MVKSRFRRNTRKQVHSSAFNSGLCRMFLFYFLCKCKTRKRNYQEYDAQVIRSQALPPGPVMTASLMLS